MAFGFIVVIPFRQPPAFFKQHHRHRQAMGIELDSPMAGVVRCGSTGVRRPMRIFDGVSLRVFAAAGVFALASAGLAQAGSTPHIAGFSAFLLNSRTGTLSADVLASGESLGNVPAGPLASISTLVVVKVDFGKGMPVPRAARVRLIATADAPARGKAAKLPLLDSVARVGPVADDGTAHVGFWLADTGCRAVTLKAALIGAPAATATTAELPFACYE
jgi:hypothetical protein